MRKEITSTSNSLIKHIIQLQKKSKVRRTEKEFIIEGAQELQLALKSGYSIKQVLVCFKIFDFEISLEEIGCEIIEISKEVFEKLAYRSTTGGIVGIAEALKLNLNELKFNTSTPLVVVAEAPEKPGNIGALLRTCDAAQADAFILADPKTDLYNPNIIRSSVGTVFTNQVAIGSTSEIIDYLRKMNIQIYAAALQNSTSYLEEDFKNATAIVLGTEHEGLTEDWRTHADKIIKIPMQGKVDSLNVSVSAAILIFEAKRQRYNLQ
ncbi:TrmH family RNA methyltransferase [Psychroflexus tropicus]|uniref:TrmH family RNA methyltransferase n=1 Tax=Psychroflexus tropicus TaxID=197345 RepID=UPI000369DF5E|nr:RNA methyltransferase [Psychroflexus tropicus]